jgi:amidase
VTLFLMTGDGKMKATELHYEPLTVVSEKIRQRQISPVEATKAMLDRIAKHDGRCHSYATLLAERAIQRARLAEEEIAKGMWRGPLHGVPIAIKDLCNTSFAPTAAGTLIHQKFVPHTNATIVDRLERAGAVILGKLKMTEGAYTTHHPADQAPLNPWNTNYWVGSSSTGSAVATCAGLCYGSLGSDTGGSIRFPSATCGLTGIKPTWGRVSRHGVFPLAESLDHIGPMTRSAADAAAILGVIAGVDSHDPTTLTDPVPDYLATIRDGIRDVVIGIDRTYTSDGIAPEVVSALAEAERAFVSLGAKIRDISIPDYKKLVSLWIAMCSVETALAHADTYPKLKADYGPDLAGLIDQGRSLSGLEVVEINLLRLKFSGALAALFKDVDLLLVPTMPVPTPTLDRMSEYGEDPNVLLNILRFTAPFDFSGSPTITLPNGIDADGMPLSMQLVGRRVSEDLLARAGHAFQTVSDWHTRRPPEIDK